MKTIELTRPWRTLAMVVIAHLHEHLNGDRRTGAFHLHEVLSRCLTERDALAIWNQGAAMSRAGSKPLIDEDILGFCCEEIDLLLERRKAGDHSLEPLLEVMISVVVEALLVQGSASVDLGDRSVNRLATVYPSLLADHEARRRVASVPVSA